MKRGRRVRNSRLSRPPTSKETRSHVVAEEKFELPAEHEEKRKCEKTMAVWQPRVRPPRRPDSWVRVGRQSSDTDSVLRLVNSVETSLRRRPRSSRFFYSAFGKGEAASREEGRGRARDRRPACTLLPPCVTSSEAWLGCAPHRHRRDTPEFALTADQWPKRDGDRRGSQGRTMELPAERTERYTRTKVRTYCMHSTAEYRGALSP